MLAMKAEVKRLPKHTLQITVVVPAKDVAESQENIIKEAIKTVEIKGFRKGKAPRKVAEENLDKGKIRGEVINKLVPKAYSQAVSEHHIHPIVNPKIEITKFELGEDLEFTATVAELPEIKLKDYKKALKKLKPETKKQILGPDGNPINGSNNETDGKISIGKILEALVEEVEVEIPDLLIETETNQMMSRLIDQTAHMGLTIQQYLEAQNKKPAELRNEFAKQAEHLLKSELILQQIAKEEKIKVEQEDINKALGAAPDEESKKKLETEEGKRYIQEVLKKNKVLEYLANLIE